MALTTLLIPRSVAAKLAAMMLFARPVALAAFLALGAVLGVRINKFGA